MGKLKTRKTASKRFRRTRPRGGKGSRVLYNKSRQGHLRTKKTTRSKNRVLKSHVVASVDTLRISNLIKS